MAIVTNPTIKNPNEQFGILPLKADAVTAKRYIQDNTLGTYNNFTSADNNRFSIDEQSTRFLNQSVNFESCFERTSFTGTIGEAPDLWNCDFGNSLTSISNYSTIPSAWGGPA